MFEKVAKATESRDVDAYAELLAEDFVFVRHQNGTQMNKPETIAMLERMMSASRTNMGQRRCLYENDDILVLHSINDYPDGTREAVLSAYSLKDGKISRLETGATALPT